MIINILLGIIILLIVLCVVLAERLRHTKFLLNIQECTNWILIHDLKSIDSAIKLMKVNGVMRK